MRRDGPLPAETVVTLARQPEEHVVAPFAIDLEIVFSKSDFLEAVIYKDATRGRIVGQAGRVDTMKVQRVEYKGQDQGNRARHYAFSRKALAHPVAHGDILRGAAANVGQGQPTNETFRLAALEDQERIFGAVGRIPTIAANFCGKGLGGQFKIGPHWLKGGQKRPASEAQGAPRAVVAALRTPDRQSVTLDFGPRKSPGRECEHRAGRPYFRLSAIAE